MLSWRRLALRIKIKGFSTLEILENVAAMDDAFYCSVVLTGADFNPVFAGLWSQLLSSALVESCHLVLFLLRCKFCFTFIRQQKKFCRVGFSAEILYRIFT